MVLLDRVVVGMGVNAIQWVVVEGVEVVPVGETWRWLTEYTAGVTQPSFRRAPPSRPSLGTAHPCLHIFFLSPTIKINIPSVDFLRETYKLPNSIFG